MYFLLMEATLLAGNQDILRKSKDFKKLIDVINEHQDKGYHWWIGTSTVDGFEYDEEEYEEI